MDAVPTRSAVVDDSTPSQEVYSDVRQTPKLHKTKSIHETSETCRVCGDGHARMHYGVLTCFGCKGFFRRTLKRPTEYSCRHQGNCIVDRHERNSCRYCRFKRCLEVGMDPKAVRPDRDATGRHYQTRARRSKLLNGESTIEETPIGDDWSRKLPVDMRTTLMQLMNVELMVNNGDTHCNAKEMYPLPYTSLRQILDDPSLLDGKRTEMRYEAYRRVECDELIAIAHRRLIAVIDWIDHLFQIMELSTTDDKLALVKFGFAPLTIFSFAAQTAKSTRDNDIICLCNFGYVPRYVHRIFNEPYHLANRIIDRALDELVEPFRLLNLNDEEIVLLKAIVVLNPHLKALSQEASEQIADLRDRIQETLYHVVRETHPKEVASSRFGNLLLFLPTIMILGNVMYENLQFVQSFGRQNVDALLCELLDNIEPVDDRGIFLHSTDSCSDSSSTSYNTVKPSSSCSSISSLISHTSLSSYESQTHSDETHNDSESESFHVSLPISYAHTSLSSLDVSGVSNTVSLPNLDQVGTVTESDPDYNITLTADTFSGMRQALSTTQNMDVDTHNTPPNSPEFGYTPAATPLSRPHFFIEENARTTMFEPIGSRHKFTVTTRITNEGNDEAMIKGNMPTQSTQSDSLSFSTFHRPQIPLSKTLSCPRPGASNPHAEFMGVHTASLNLSDNDRTIHRRSPHIIMPSASHDEIDFMQHLSQHSNDNLSSDYEMLQRKEIGNSTIERAHSPMQKPSTTNQHKQQVVDGGEQSQNKVTKERLLEAVHFACMQISDEVVEEVQTERGVNLEFEGCVLAQVAHLVTDALCSTWPDDLLLFAKHGKRSIVNVNDIKLLMRKNESLVKLIDEELGKVPSTRRQKSVSAPHSESSTAVDEEDSNEPKKLNNRASSGRRGRPLNKKTNANLNLNASKITDFLVSDSGSMAGPSKVTDNASLSGITDDEHSRSSMLSGDWLPLERHSGAVTSTAGESLLQRDSSPAGGLECIVYDDLSNPFGLTVNSDGKTLDDSSKKVVEVGHKGRNKQERSDLRTKVQQRGGKANTKRKAQKGGGNACKRRAAKPSKTTSTSREMAEDDKISDSSWDVEEFDESNTSLEMIFSSVVDKCANESDALKIKNSKLEGFVQNCRTKEGVTVTTEQGICKSVYKETPSRFDKTVQNAKPTMGRMRMEEVDSSSNSHLKLISVEARTVSPMSNDHLRREDIAKSGGSSRDIFASPSPISCNAKQLKGPINANEISRSDIVVNNSSALHRPGPCRNLSETLQSQQSELMTAISRRGSASSKEDSIDSSTWDAIDFDAIDAAVINTSHGQQQSNRKVTVNQCGGIMLPERITEQQVVTPNETNISEKRTTSVGHRFDGFSDFNFESDEDENVRKDAMASSKLERHTKDSETANVYKVCNEDKTCRSDAHRSGGGNDRIVGNPTNLSKQVKQSNAITTASKRQQEELKNRISKEFSTFTFESDEEEEVVEENINAKPSTSSTIPTKISTTRASITAKNNTIKNFSLFNFESDEDEKGCEMRTATASTDINKSLNGREASAANMTDEITDSVEDDCDLDATIFD